MKMSYEFKVMKFRKKEKAQFEVKYGQVQRAKVKITPLE
jgi:hypothetical protein